MERPTLPSRYDRERHTLLVHFSGHFFYKDMKTNPIPRFLVNDCILSIENKKPTYCRDKSRYEPFLSLHGLIMGGAPRAPVLPLSTKVDTLFMKVIKQADTKNIGKGLFLSADNSKT